MKHIIILACLSLTVGVTISAAQSNQNTNTHQTDYLQKSKHQKTSAWILLGGGGTFIVTGIIIPRGEVTHEGFWNSYKNDGIKGSFVLSGTLAMLGSIPLFIAAGKNKRKGTSLSFKNEKMLQLQKSSLAYRSIPSLSVKINL